MLKKIITLLKISADKPVKVAPVSTDAQRLNKMLFGQAKYRIGQVVHHRNFDFRGVIFDVDPEFSNTEEWYLAIPESLRPHRDQPYYHLFAENEDSHYMAYVSEQNLVPDETQTPINNPDIKDIFIIGDNGQYRLRAEFAN